MASIAPGRLRLVAQRLVGDRPGSALEAATWMTCMQGQQLPAARTAWAMRVEHGSLEAIDAALNSGEVVRSWPMRGTLHLVPAADLLWMLRITAPLIERSMRTRWTDLGLTATDRDRDERVTRDLLRGGRSLTRRALIDAWTQAGIDTEGQTAAHRIVRLALAGVICFGPMSGRQQCVVLCDEWIGSPRSLERDEAITEWATRYLRSHGPATLKDFLWWTGLRMKDVRPIWDDATRGLEQLDIDGATHYLDPDTLARYEAIGRGSSVPLLTPAFDEIILGYTDRSATVRSDHLDLITPGRNGMFRAVVLDAGRAVGTWSRDRRSGVQVTPFDGSVSPKVERALPRLEDRLPS